MTPQMVMDWMMSLIFWMAVILFVFGLGLAIMPVRMMAWGRSLNKVVSTEDFFESLDGPRYYESLIYRYHWVSGAAIVVLAATVIYMLAFYTSMETVLAGIAALVNHHPFYQWLLEILYYLLLVLNVIALGIGVIVFVRPSLLKNLEAWGNRWVDTRASLKKLDEEHEIPENILPGRPRWFGLFVCLGAAYMIYMTAPFVL